MSCESVSSVLVCMWVSERFDLLTSGLIVDDAGEMLDAKLCLVGVLGWDVVGVELVL